MLTKKIDKRLNFLGELWNHTHLVTSPGCQAYSSNVPIPGSSVASLLTPGRSAQIEAAVASAMIGPLSTTSSSAAAMLGSYSSKRCYIQVAMSDLWPTIFFDDCPAFNSNWRRPRCEFLTACTNIRSSILDNRSSVMHSARDLVRPFNGCIPLCQSRDSTNFMSLPRTSTLGPKSITDERCWMALHSMKDVKSLDSMKDMKVLPSTQGEVIVIVHAMQQPTTRPQCARSDEDTPRQSPPELRALQGSEPPKSDHQDPSQSQTFYGTDWWKVLLSKLESPLQSLSQRSVWLKGCNNHRTIYLSILNNRL